MERLIDVNKVIDSMQKCLDESPDKRHSVAYFAFESIIELLKKEPTLDAADVAPVRRGRWFDVQETELYVPDMKFTMTKTAETCSECKVRIGFVGAKQYLYDAVCPNCGAKMDGERRTDG